MKGKKSRIFKKLTVFLLVFVISFCSFIQPAHAGGLDIAITLLEKGIGYVKDAISGGDSNADEGKQKPKGNLGQIEYKKKECFIDPLCHLEEWLKGIIVDAWNSTIDWFYNFMKITPGEVLGSRGLDQYGNPASQPKDPTTKNISIVIAEYYGYFETAAWVFLELFFVFQIIQVLSRYILDADISELKDLLYRLVASAVLLGTLPYIISLILTFNNWFISDLVATQIDFKNNSLIDVASATGAILFMILGTVCMLIFVILQQLIRYAEICFMVVIGPLVVATYVNKNFNLLAQWWKALLSTVFTQSVQLLLFVLFLKTMAGAKAESLVSYFLPIGFLLLVIKSPAALQDLIYNSGTEKISANTSMKAGKKTAQGAKWIGKKAKSLVT